MAVKDHCTGTGTGSGFDYCWHCDVVIGQHTSARRDEEREKVCVVVCVVLISRLNKRHQS